MQAEEQAALAALVRGQRQAALGTLDDGQPFVSMVLYVVDTGPSFLIHVSRLSAHTRHLEATPRASLLVMQPDTGSGNPQELARITMQVEAQRLDRESEAYKQGKSRYIARLPDSAMLFDFPDFSLYRLVPMNARYIGGFARAYSLTAEQLRQALEPGLNP
jgi:hypothetical protein